MLLVYSNVAIINDEGKLLSTTELAHWIFANTPVPAYTGHANQISDGLLAGVLFHNELLMGEDAGRLAQSILENKIPPEWIKPHVNTRGYMLPSRKQMEYQACRYS